MVTVLVFPPGGGERSSSAATSAVPQQQPAATAAFPTHTEGPIFMNDSGWMGRRTDRQTERWMDRRRDGWMDGEMDETGLLTIARNMAGI